jgi:hypothetical protein
MITVRSGLAEGSPKTAFEKVYDFYFPKSENGSANEYRSYFDSILFGPALSERYRKRDRLFYRAFQGDSRALHEFLNNEDRDLPGEFGIFWARECLVLLLKWGDLHFASRLAHENKSTQAMVGYAVGGPVEWGWRQHSFPKTRAIYKSASGSAGSN